VRFVGGEGDSLDPVFNHLVERVRSRLSSQHLGEDRKERFRYRAMKIDRLNAMQM
jgi:hypothetical protein